jgi:O-antigen ligase
MVEPHGAPAPEVIYIPREETKSPPSSGPSIWLILTTCVLIPGAIAYALAVNEAAYAIAAFLALLVGLAILAQPFIGLMVFLVLVYCRPEELVPQITGMRLTLIVTAFTLLGAWLHVFVNKQKLTKSPVAGFMLGVAVIAPLTNLVVGGDPGEAVRETLMLLFLVLLVLNLVRTRAMYQAFVTGLIGVTAYLAGYSIYLSQMGIGYMQKDGETRFIRTLTEGSIFQDPNDLASALVPGLALVMLRIIQAKGWRKIPYVAIAALLLVSTFDTQSRGGFIALIIMMGAFAVLTIKKKAIAIGVAIVLGAAVLVGASDRMSNIDTEDESAQSRMQFWQNGFDALRESPIFGVGYANYPELNFHNQAPHNTFMQALVELGPFGFFCFMALFYYAFRKPTAAARDALPSEKDRLDLLGARISLAGFMIAAFFLSRAFVPCLYIQCCLPIVQQISASGRPDIVDVTPKERFKDWIGIGIWCVAIVGIVKIMLYRYL